MVGVTAEVINLMDKKDPVFCLSLSSGITSYIQQYNTMSQCVQPLIANRLFLGTGSMVIIVFANQTAVGFHLCDKPNLAGCRSDSHIIRKTADISPLGGKK